MLPVADRHTDYAERGRRRAARGRGARAASTTRSESVGKKIRDAELAKLPYMLVVGDREEEAGTASVRSHDEGDLGQMTVADFAAGRLGAAGCSRRRASRATRRGHADAPAAHACLYFAADAGHRTTPRRH